MNGRSGAATALPMLHDRIDVTDDYGVRIGWVDPRTGTRTLLAHNRSAEFDSMVDFWMVAAGLSGVETADTFGASPGATDVRQSMHVIEVRYLDREVIRSLLIPLPPMP